MFLFRIIVILAFVTRLLTGCCAGGCPAANTRVTGAESARTVCHACHDPNCSGDCGGCHAHCCQPFGGELPSEEQSPAEEGSPAEPCDCPGHSHHFCLGTHLFAVGEERSEVPALDVQFLAVMPGIETADLPLTGRWADWAAVAPLQAFDAREMRAVLQVYVL